MQCSLTTSALEFAGTIHDQNLAPWALNPQPLHSCRAPCLPLNHGSNLTGFELCFLLDNVSSLKVDPRQKKGLLPSV